MIIFERVQNTCILIFRNGNVIKGFKEKFLSSSLALYAYISFNLVDCFVLDWS